PAPAHAKGLEVSQLPVHQRISAGNSFAANAVPRHDPLALEEQLGKSAWIRLAREERRATRPASLRRRDGVGTTARETARPALGPRRLEAARCPKRLPCVVRHLAGPDELPQGRERRLGVQLGLAKQVEPEERAAIERRTDAVVGLPLRWRKCRGAAQGGRILAEIKSDPLETRTDPHDFARGGELVELRRLEPGHTPREDVGLPERDGKRDSLERDERLPQRRPPVDAVPAGEEASERLVVDRLDLLAQRGEARAAEAAKDIGFAPFALRAARPKLAPHETALALEAAELRFRPLGGEGEPHCYVSGREGAAAPRVADQKTADGVLSDFEEGIRQARGRHCADGVAVAAGVLGGDQARLTSDANLNGSALGLQRLRQGGVVLAGTKVAPAEEEIVKLVGALRRPAQLFLDLLDGGRVDEVAELLLPEELFQQVAIERERLGAALRERRVVFVHVRRHVVEEERRRVRGGRRRLDFDDIDAALPKSDEQVAEGRQIEDVLQALTVGLEDDREVGVPAGDLQKPLGFQALLPERRALAGPAARDEERARGVLPKTSSEERRSRQLRDDDLLQLRGVDEDVVERRRRVSVG